MEECLAIDLRVRDIEKSEQKGKREEGKGKREEGRGKREEEKVNKKEKRKGRVRVVVKKMTKGKEERNIEGERERDNDRQW